MLDLTISPQNHAYQFRVDVLDSSGALFPKQCYKKQLAIMLGEEEFRDYICSLEVGEKTGKLHYQCILWHRNKLTTKERNRIKAKYFRKNRDTPNSISFTDAKKITNLASYCLKDLDEENKKYLLCSLSDEKREKLPDWLTKNAIKQKWEKEVEDEMLLLISEDVYGHRPSPYNVGKSIVEFYLKNDHPFPTRMKLYKLLLKYHPEFTIDDYLKYVRFME